MSETTKPQSEKSSKKDIQDLTDLKNSIISNETLTNKDKLIKAIELLGDHPSVLVDTIKSNLTKAFDIIKELSDENSKKIINQAIGLFLLKPQTIYFYDKKSFLEIYQTIKNLTKNITMM